MILSSECLQPEEKDWKHLSIFFQLLPVEVLTQVIYTNKTSDMCHLQVHTLVACAEYAFSGVRKKLFAVPPDCLKPAMCSLCCTLVSIIISPDCLKLVFCSLNNKC